MDKTVREAVEEEISSLASSLPRGSMDKIHIEVLGDDGEYVTYRFSREQEQRSAHLQRRAEPCMDEADDRRGRRQPPSRRMSPAQRLMNSVALLIQSLDAVGIDVQELGRGEWLLVLSFTRGERTSVVRFDHERGTPEDVLLILTEAIQEMLRDGPANGLD